MKNILLFFAFMLPVLAFGQVLQKVEVNMAMKTAFIETVEFSEIFNPYEIKEEEFNFSIKDYPLLTTPPSYYRLWSGCRISPVHVLPVYGKRA